MANIFVQILPDHSADLLECALRCLGVKDGQGGGVRLGKQVLQGSNVLAHLNQWKWNPSIKQISSSKDGATNFDENAAIFPGQLKESVGATLVAFSQLLLVLLAVGRKTVPPPSPP
jgi:hypothetical protein